MAQQMALSHTWGPPLPGTTEQDRFSAMKPVQASHFASESSSRSLQVTEAPASQFNSKHGFQGQQQLQKPSNTQDGSSCMVISFNCSPSLELEGPTILPFQTQPSQKPMHTASPLFNMQFGQPEQQSTGFVADSSADANAGMTLGILS